jgi:hypothetical protein
MPYQPTVSKEPEFEGLPRRLPDQNAILIGRVPSDGEFAGLAAYYIHGRGSILIGRYENQEFKNLKRRSYLSLASLYSASGS